MADRTIVLAQNKRHAVRGVTVVNPQEFSAYQEDDDDLTYIVDMSSYLDGATISSVTRTPTGVVVSNTSNTTTRLTQRLKGFGYVDINVTSSSGEVEQFRITIQPRGNSAFFLSSTGSVPPNTAQFFATIAEAAATNPAASVGYIWVSGYTSPADGRGGLYKKVTAATNADTFTTANGLIYERSFATTAISAPPASVGAHTGLTNSFTGDITGIRYPVSHTISGATTLTQPATGYKHTPETSPFYVWLVNSSGWNESTSGDDGRTMASAFHTRVSNTGLGDTVAYLARGLVTGTKPGATKFFANSAIGLFAGDCFAGANGVYLNPLELICEDQGFDAAAVGGVFRLYRTNPTGALDTFWTGLRVQSQGTERIDVGLTVTGPVKYGIDLSYADLDANAAAMTLEADMRIYGNVTAGDSASRFPTALGTSYQTYSSSLGAWHFVINNNSALQIYSSVVISPLAIRSDTEYRVSTNKVVGARDTGWTAMTGTSNKNTSYDTATVTTAQLAGRVMAIQAALTTHGLLGA